VLEGDRIADVSRERGRAPVVTDMFTTCPRADSDVRWARARALAPIVFTEELGGLWLVTRYDEVRDAFRDWERLSSARTDPARSSISPTAGPVPLLVPEELDPPDWHAPRRILAGLLSPTGSEALRPRIRHWCDFHLDQFVEAGHADLVTDLALAVPMAVTMEFLGFPREEWESFAAAFHDIPAHPPGHPKREAAVEAMHVIMRSIAREVHDRCTDPSGDDAISAMLRGAGELDVPIDVIEALVFQTMGGGVDTTAALASAAFVHLGTDTGLRDRLAADRSLVPAATEEFLRFYPPARTHARTVAVDHEVAGCPLKQGDRVVLSEVSANRDERAFPDADVFDIDRFPNRHISFGMGIHRCPGSHLARIEFEEILNAVLDQIPDFEIVAPGPVEYPSWAMLGGWASIPVAFTPRPAGRSAASA
jgi:cytochrome P450